MTPHDLGQLALLLSPAMLLSVLLLFTSRPAVDPALTEIAWPHHPDWPGSL